MEDNYGFEVKITGDSQLATCRARETSDVSFDEQNSTFQSPNATQRIPYRTTSPTPPLEVIQSLELKITSTPFLNSEIPPPQKLLSQTPEFALSPSRFRNRNKDNQANWKNKPKNKTFKCYGADEDVQNATNLSKAEKYLLVPALDKTNIVEPSGISVPFESLSLNKEIAYDESENIESTSTRSNAEENNTEKAKKSIKTKRKGKSNSSRSDGKIQVRRTKQIKDEVKAQAKRLRINCQKMNLKPYNEFEPCHNDTTDTHYKMLRCKNHLSDFYQSRLGFYDYSDDEDSDDDVEFQGMFSSSIVTHEILRANWTWCTAWSPDGKRLAIASENCPLAILDTKSLPVWKIVYRGPYTYSNKPFSIRAMAWGEQFIAIGGTSDVVTILDGNDYKIRHKITDIGYVGALDWKERCCILAIGSRCDYFLLVRIIETPFETVQSEILIKTTRDDWVNAVSFSHLGGLIAIGDQKGIASVYSLNESQNKTDINLVTNYVMEDAILFVSWSSDGKWLFMGGEDYSLSVIDTTSWNLVKEIRRDLWVCFGACTNSGTHIAIGGACSKINLYEIGRWTNPKSIEFNGDVVLDAKWAPNDKYLSVCGQDGTTKVIDLVKSNYANSGYIRFTSEVQSLDISPDGRYIAVGKDDGIVSFVDRKLVENSDSIIYEVVITDGSNLSHSVIQWSPDNRFVAIGSGDLVLIFVESRGTRKKSRIQNSRFSIHTIIRDLKDVYSISFSPTCTYLIICGARTKLFHVKRNFAFEIEFKRGPILCASWCQDGSFLALSGEDKTLAIFDTRDSSCNEWKVMFDLTCESNATALSWGPSVNGQLYYLAYGGKDDEVTVIEIRSIEGYWVVVIELPCLGTVLDMDWRRDGMLAIASSNGSASIVDLTYLLSGASVNQMDYNWQRQGITCSVLIQRKMDCNSINALRWLDANVTKDHILVLGGSDGVAETINLSIS